MFTALRDWLFPPNALALPILTEIDRKKLGINCFVYGGQLGVPRTYRVTIREERCHFIHESTGEGRTFDEALTAAWVLRFGSSEKAVA